MRSFGQARNSSIDVLAKDFHALQMLTRVLLSIKLKMTSSIEVFRIFFILRDWLVKKQDA